MSPLNSHPARAQKGTMKNAVEIFARKQQASGTHRSNPEQRSQLVQSEVRRPSKHESATSQMVYIAALWLCHLPFMYVLALSCLKAQEGTQRSPQRHTCSSREPCGSTRQYPSWRGVAAARQTQNRDSKTFKATDGKEPRDEDGRREWTCVS